MKLKEAFLEKYRSDKVLLGEWILTIVTAVFIFVSIAYVDMRSLTVWSTNVWDVTFDSNIRHLYEYTAKNIYGLRHVYLGSELFSVLPWSVWNLPIWAIQRFTGRAIADSAVMLAYSKLFLVALSVVMLRYTKKIAMILTEGDKTKSTWAVFLSASSTFLFLGVLYAGQNDIVMITVSVIAVYYLLKGKQLPFMILSMIAISIKPFFLLPFLAVLLLFKKSILKAIGWTLFSVIGVVAQKLIFNGAPMYKESMLEGPSQKMLQQMFTGNLTTSFGKASMFAIALVLIYLYAYTRDFTDKDVKEQNVTLAKYAVYFVALTNTAYLMFSPFTFYRIAMLVPFLYLVIVQNEKMYFYNGVLETALATGMLLKLGLRQSSSLFRAKAINGALIQRLFGYSVPPHEEGNYVSLNSYLTFKKSLLLYFQPLFSGVAVISALLLLILNHPDQKIKPPLFGEKNCRVLLWARIVIIVPFILATLYLYLIYPERIY